MSEYEPENLPDPAEGLSPRQALFLEMLLSKRTVKAAAEAAEVSERTAYRWAKAEGAFRNAYRALRRQGLDNAVGQLQLAAEEAVEALREALAAEDVNVRVRAAGMVLDRAMKSAEADDVSERLEAIEAALRVRSGGAA